MKNWTGKWFKKIPIEEAVRPKPRHRAIVNHWWEIRNECILGYGMNGRMKYLSPQCNQDINVTKHFKHEDSEIAFIPVVFWPEREE